MTKNVRRLVNSLLVIIIVLVVTIIPVVTIVIVIIIILVAMVMVVVVDIKASIVMAHLDDILMITMTVAVMAVPTIIIITTITMFVVNVLLLVIVTLLFEDTLSSAIPLLLLLQLHVLTASKSSWVTLVDMQQSMKSLTSSVISHAICTTFGLPRILMVSVSSTIVALIPKKC